MCFINRCFFHIPLSTNVIFYQPMQHKEPCFFAISKQEALLQSYPYNYIYKYQHVGGVAARVGCARVHMCVC